MPAKIRLQRYGKKGFAFFHIVVADTRAPRDGKYIERIGAYNPNTNPATIDINVDKAVQWLANGAQPTDTCRAILSYKGVLYKKHLLGGVAKGSFDMAEADKRFATWLETKEGKVQAKRDLLANESVSDKAARLKAEVARKEEIAKKVSAKAAAALPAVEEVEEAPAEEAVVETAAEVEAPVVEAATVAEATEEATDKAMEVAPEEAVEAVNEAAEEVKAEAAIEEPATEEEPKEDKE